MQLLQTVKQGHADKESKRRYKVMDPINGVTKKEIKGDKNKKSHAVIQAKTQSKMQTLHVSQVF